jgi:hypothetical protein
MDRKRHSTIHSAPWLQFMGRNTLPLCRQGYAAFALPISAYKHYRYRELTNILNRSSILHGILLCALNFGPSIVFSVHAKFNGRALNSIGQHWR